MLLLYNIIQLVFLMVFFPVLLLFVLCKEKYRGRILKRLGLGLSQKLNMRRQAVDRRIWFHALSVGEVTSVAPLIQGLRKKHPNTQIILSTTTHTGRKVAESLLFSTADCIIDGPLDIYPVIKRFIKMIAPDCFVLVETDFWPNILLGLQGHNIPTLLVNGRISSKSLQRYRRFWFFFKPMFMSFTSIAMQTKEDKEKLESLGIENDKLQTLGNLKYAQTIPATHYQLAFDAKLLHRDRIVLIGGSTHRGEEEALITCMKALQSDYPELFLVLAPRDPKRVKEIEKLAEEHKLTTCRRTRKTPIATDIFILDTIGELTQFYALSDIAFVGGSLVKKGGHNPIEAAILAKPIIFGPYMEDFSEIASSLVAAHGALQVANQNELLASLRTLAKDATLRQTMGASAASCVTTSHHDVLASHLQLIEDTW